MIPALLPLLALPAAQPGAIPHLMPDQLAVVSEGGGGLGYVGHLSVARDGTVVYTSSTIQKPAQRVRWRMTRGELGALRLLIANTDFPALHRAPRAPNPPSAVDGLDRGLAVHQGNAVRGWTNTVWLPPDRPVPLFERLADLITHSRELARV